MSQFFFFLFLGLHVQSEPKMWQIFQLYLPTHFVRQIVFIKTVHRGAFFQFLFRWIHYCHSSKSTGKETGKTHLCAPPWVLSMTTAQLISVSKLALNFIGVHCADWQHSCRKDKTSCSCILQIKWEGDEKSAEFEKQSKLHIPSTINIDFILWHTQLIVYALAYFDIKKYTKKPKLVIFSANYIC